MATSVNQATKLIEDESLAEENLLDELEDLEIPAHIREARLSALKHEASVFGEMKERQHGCYTDILAEKDFLDMTTSEDRCVIHFYHADFRRCAIMDQHLENLATKHFETKFAKISVDKAKFFVNKLKIQILPAVFCFDKGVVADRIIGFDELGNMDDFPTDLLERRLASSGVIKCSEPETKKETSIFGRKTTNKNKQNDDDDTDSDNDW